MFDFLSYQTGFVHWSVRFDELETDSLKPSICRAFDPEKWHPPFLKTLQLDAAAGNRRRDHANL
jgi:hypothetical protein